MIETRVYVFSQAYCMLLQKTACKLIVRRIEVASNNRPSPMVSGVFAASNTLFSHLQHGDFDYSIIYRRVYDILYVK